MAMNRKAFFLTFISILVVSLFIMTFATNVNVRTPETSRSSWARIDTIDRYVSELRNLYLDRAVSSSGHAAFVAMTDYMSATGRPMRDVEQNFTELMLNGTLGGIPQPKMKNMTLRNWSDRLRNLSVSTFGFDTNITPRYVQIQQTTPWAVNIQVDFSVRVNKTEIIYRFDETSDVNLSIVERKDPLHALNGFDRTIYPGNISNWTSGSSFLMLQKQWYWHNKYNPGPSWLMRFENDTGFSACCGIESLLNGSYGLFNRSYVDYKFWNGTRDVCSESAGNITVFGIFGATATAEGLGRFRLDGMDVLNYNSTSTGALC